MKYDWVSSYSTAPTPTATGCSGLLRPRQCRYRDFQSLCYHSTCRRAFLRQHRRLLNSSSSAVVPAEAGGLELERPDERLFTCLTECVQRIREPFSPEEPLDTQAAETLEQEYNRMDTCIRRIIRVVKMLPYFNEIGKPAQLGLLRANIYGMIVLYSSFFFEREIRKLRYPVKQADGSLTTVTVSMLDDLAPSAVSDEKAFTAFLSGKHRHAASAAVAAASLREDFELYKVSVLLSSSLVSRHSSSCVYSLCLSHFWNCGR
ncbi:unnamed protein product [Hydatigera taeniaeformis]|uniref:NR LBD domain-containing protein n=1 Tax=Hydatigena taeniaeformis TaxID=6205 RepID=A0A0R3WUN1_HYDTA|nr:unnamed protein product [Hydatigera taeniaeformis]